MRSLADLWRRARQGGAFLAFDEFARTTSSAEAEAILSAAVEALAALPGTRSLVARTSTGWPGCHVRYLRMLGLDRTGAANGHGRPTTPCPSVSVAEPPDALPDRRRARRGLSDCEPAGGGAPRGWQRRPRRIARLLGVDGAIVSRAEQFLAERRRGGGGNATSAANAEAQ